METFHFSGPQLKQVLACPFRPSCCWPSRVCAACVSPHSSPFIPSLLSSSLLILPSLSPVSFIDSPAIDVASRRSRPLGVGESSLYRLHASWRWRWCVCYVFGCGPSTTSSSSRGGGGARCPTTLFIFLCRGSASASSSPWRCCLFA